MSTDSSDLFGALFETPPATRTVPVLVPLPAPRPYSYAVPEGMAVEPGSVVQVPLGPRQVIGVVWDGGEDGVDPKKLRPITHVFDRGCAGSCHAHPRVADDLTSDLSRGML